MNSDDLHTLVYDALRQIIVEEWDLAVVDAHERTITSHLSRLITNMELAEWMRVDHDYGRHLSDPKRARLTAGSDDDEDLFIPDIVIHRRGSGSDNLLALEAKKAQQHDPRDEAKIRALLRDPYNYVACLLLEFGIKSHRDESWWNPSWCWMSDPNEPIAYEAVFNPDECARLNDEGKQRWRRRF